MPGVIRQTPPAKVVGLSLLTVCALISQLHSGRAAPVYIGLQESGVNGGAITEEASGNGSASISNFNYGDSTDGFFNLNVSTTGTPPLPEPYLNSNVLTATGSHPGIIAIYVTETNQNPVGFSDFYSVFGVSSVGAGITITESTYVHECAVPNVQCNTTIGGDVFATTTLLSTKTFSATGSVTEYSGNGLPLTTIPYALTEVYTIAFTQTNTSVNASIDMKVPEPMSVLIFGVGLLGLGVMRRRVF